MGKDDLYEFHDVGDSEFLHEVAAMVFDGADGAMEDTADLTIAFAFDDELQDAFFGACEGFCSG